MQALRASRPLIVQRVSRKSTVSVQMGFTKTILREGTGPTPQRGQAVTVHWWVTFTSHLIGLLEVLTP